MEKVVRDEIFKHKNLVWNKRLGKLDKNSKPFWNISKALRKKMYSIPPLKSNDNVYTVNSDKANLLAEQFIKNHNIFNSDNDAIDVVTKLHIDVVNNVVEHFNNLDPITNSLEFISETLVKEIVKNLKIKKASGHDEITNNMLKHLPSVGISYLTFIINSCLKLQYFPEAWKTAKVIPIFKPGKDPSLSESYRPISLLSSLSKILEKIVKIKLCDFIDENNILPAEQFGFREFHSTTQQIKRIVNHVKQNLRDQKSTGLILLDIEKAFDSVWHNGLIYKLINFQFPLFLIKIIKCFLFQRHFCVYLNDEYSDILEVPAGVPQGSVIGPILYTIYCSDLPKFPSCQYAFYADDTAIFNSNKFGDFIVIELQHALDSIVSYFKKWKIKLNASKTQAIFFTRRRSFVYLPNSKVISDGHEIQWMSNVRYLGVHLDPKLTFQCHVSNIIKKINISIKLLYPLINRKSFLSTENKIILVKVIFQSIILYACPVWEGIAKTHIKKLQICQNKLLKLCLKLPWFYSTKKLHEISKTDYIENKILKITNKFKINCNFSEIECIKNLYT